MRWRLWEWTEDHGSGWRLSAAYSALRASCWLRPHKWARDPHSRPPGSDWQCLYCDRLKRTVP